LFFYLYLIELENMDSQPKNYELAYLLSPSIAEEEVLTHVGKINALTEESEGTIRRAEEPKKRKLAYPIKKESWAYFGWTTFSLLPETIITLDKKLKENKLILRYLVSEEEIETRPQSLRIMQPRPLSSRRVAPRQKPAEKLDLEALDKKLEEILGK